MTILVIDDERDIQRLFEQRFRKERRNGTVDLHFAFSAKEALGFLKAEKAKDLQIILSDINMPQMSGLELLKGVRQQHPLLRIYMITAFDDKQNKQKAFDFGATDYLTKPINFDSLKKLIFNGEE